MKRFLSTTAVLLTLSGAAYADGHATGFGAVTAEKTDFFASNLIGMRIYNSETKMDDDAMVADGAEREWDDIGEINDIIISADGDVRAVILGVGGFLGLGERDVSVSMDEIKVVREEGDSDDLFLVVTTSKEMLEKAPAFERDADTAEADAAKNTETETATANAAKDEDTEMAEAGTKVENPADDKSAKVNMLERPQVERDGYQEADVELIKAMTAEDLQGSYVYGSNDETVGEIDSLILDDSGTVSKVVINVGGFLGLGEKPVAVTFDELQVLKNADGDDFRIYIDSTEEKLEALPEYAS